MITTPRFKRALDKLIPLPEGVENEKRYTAVMKSGFVRHPYADSDVEHGHIIRHRIFQARYMEFIRYNKHLIEFHLL